jgi:hypothetical protein
MTDQFDLHNRAIERLERENAALRRTLDVLSRAGDIESARGLARGVLSYLRAAEREPSPHALIPIEDERAACLADLAALRLRTGPLTGVSIAEAAAAETIARTAIDAEREVRER